MTFKTEKKTRKIIEIIKNVEASKLNPSQAKIIAEKLITEERDDDNALMAYVLLHPSLQLEEPLKNQIQKIVDGDQNVEKLTQITQIIEREIVFFVTFSKQSQDFFEPNLEEMSLNIKKILAVYCSILATHYTRKNVCEFAVETTENEINQEIEKIKITMKRIPRVR